LIIIQECPKIVGGELQTVVGCSQIRCICWFNY